MIGTLGRVKVYAYCSPVDIRNGFEGLSAMVTLHLGKDTAVGRCSSSSPTRRGRGEGAALRRQRPVRVREAAREGSLRGVHDVDVVRELDRLDRIDDLDTTYGVLQAGTCCHVPVGEPSGLRAYRHDCGADRGEGLLAGAIWHASTARSGDPWRRAERDANIFNR